MSLVAGGDHRGAGPAGASHVCMDFFCQYGRGNGTVFGKKHKSSAERGSLNLPGGKPGYGATDAG